MRTTGLGDLTVEIRSLRLLGTKTGSYYAVVTVPELSSETQLTPATPAVSVGPSGVVEWAHYARFSGVPRAATLQVQVFCGTDVILHPHGSGTLVGEVEH